MVLLYKERREVEREGERRKKRGKEKERGRERRKKRKTIYRGKNSEVKTLSRQWYHHITNDLMKVVKDWPVVKNLN